MKTISQSALDFINEQIAAGRTLYIGTRVLLKVTPKTFKKWDDAGKPLFTMHKNGELWYSAGKNPFIIASKDFKFAHIRAVSN